MKVLITGAGGFIGRHLCKHLSKKDLDIIAISRKESIIHHNITYINHAFSKDTNWADILKGIDVVVHLAGIAHTSNINPEKYHDVNVEATENLTKQAVKSDVKRLIFLSSISVNGNTSKQPFNESDEPYPETPYANSKHLAEIKLRQISEQSNLETVIIRPPLVYGSEAKGNFAKLLRLTNLPIPLPLGATENKRSFIYIGNLNDFIELCITHAKAANETFLISDDDDVSTSKLIEYINKAKSKMNLIFPFPRAWLILLLQWFGKSSIANRLFGNLQVNTSKAKSLLDWEPRFTTKEGIEHTIKG